MVSISTDKNGNRRIIFTNLGGKHDAIYVGKLRMRDTETIASKIEALISALASRRPFEPDLAEWVADGMQADRTELVERLERLVERTFHRAPERRAASGQR